MRLTTTASFEGFGIKRYLGVVAAEVIFGAHAGKDVLARIRDSIGGRAGSYENVVKETRSTALREMWKNAKQMGADAVVGVRLDYHSLGQENSMMMVCASGTAVVLDGSYQTKIPSYADVLNGAGRRARATSSCKEAEKPPQPPAQISSRLPVA